MQFVFNFYKDVRVFGVNFEDFTMLLAKRNTHQDTCKCCIMF